MGACIALIADFRQSRRQSGFAARRDRLLRVLSRTHREYGWLDADYAVTAWDEFQGLVVDAGALPSVLWDVYREAQPMTLRIGLGCGDVERAPSGKGGVNATLTGPAFHHARRALEDLGQRRRGAGQAAIRLVWDDVPGTAAINAALRLIDLRVSAITLRQWEVISLYEREGRQDAVAAALDRSESTVSRTLTNAQYWDIRASLDDLGTFMAAYPPLKA